MVAAAREVISKTSKSEQANNQTISRFRNKHCRNARFYVKVNDAEGIIFTLLNFRKLSYSYPCALSSETGITDKNPQKSDDNPLQKKLLSDF